MQINKVKNIEIYINKNVINNYVKIRTIIELKMEAPMIKEVIFTFSF